MANYFRHVSHFWLEIEKHLKFNAKSKEMESCQDMQKIFDKIQYPFMVQFNKLERVGIVLNLRTNMS